MSGSNLIKAHIRLAERKGLLHGNLNSLQDEALQWLIIDEVRQNAEIERERMKYTILAGNIHLWRELYDEEEEDENVPRDEDVDWFTPQSAEDIENIEEILTQLDRQSGGERPEQVPS